MKTEIFLATAVLFFAGCTGLEYKEFSSPLYAYENFKDAIEANDLGFAWSCLSIGMQEKEFGNDFERFREGIEGREPELLEILNAEYVSEKIIEQGAEMLLKMKEGNIHFVNENGDWKMNSFLLSSG